MMLPELIAGLGVRPADPRRPLPASVRVCDLTEDSRTVVPGSLFIARKGARVDGRQFVQAALRAGAVAILADDPTLQVAAPLLVPDDPAALADTTARLAERFYGDPTGRLTLIGVTGTKGKTTTAHLIHQVLNQTGTRSGLIGTVVVDDGVEVAPATLTTPPATELSRTFARMIDAGCRAAAMEVSSHALDQSRVAGLRFSVGVFTNLSGDHLDYHGTMDRYAAAKARLFSTLPTDGTAIVNAEDPVSESMVRGCPAAVLRCFISDAERPSDMCCPTCCCRASIASVTMRGTDVTIAGPWGEFDAHLRLIGRHNVMNALQAVAACWAAGVEADDLKGAIEQAAPPPGRFEPVTSPDDPFAVLVDYAHTDDAIRKALGALRPLTESRLRIVFGCGGDRDRSKRPRMGAAAVELADDVYITSDNPRAERPEAIIAEILEGIAPPRRDRLRVDPDRRSAIARAVDDARPGDIVLIAGKGHETYQILPDEHDGTVTIAFDDREVARCALAGRAARPVSGGA